MIKIGMLNALKPDWSPSDCTSDPTYNKFEKYIVDPSDLQWDEVQAKNEFFKLAELPPVVDLLLPFEDEA